MAAALNPLVVFWSGRGIHVTVAVSFAVQVTLLLLADIRRRTDWPVLKVIIWSAYMLADTTAIYALGHLSVVVTSPEHRLMALWAPLLLVHLGGQDNITAYAIEDNRLWLRHLQAFGVQVLAAGYVLYASSILLHPSLLRSATILMYVVGVVKYGERVWALIGANSCASSNLVITSYKDFGAEPAAGFPAGYPRDMPLTVLAHSLLDIPKKMFEGPTRYVKIENATSYEGKFMLEVVEMQLTMMYDLLYTKAAVVHTWYGFIVRLVSLPFTVAALQLFHTLRDKDGYRRADVVVTEILLTGAVVLETISVWRCMFSMWTAALLHKRKWNSLALVSQRPELFISYLLAIIVGSNEMYWSGHMRQHSLFKVSLNTNSSRGSRIAKMMGLEDLWDSTFYSWSTSVDTDIISKVLDLVSTPEARHVVPSDDRGTEARQVIPLSNDTVTELRQAVPSDDTVTEAGQAVASDDTGTEARPVGIEKSRGRDALWRHSLSLGKDLTWSVELDLDESILVWHIATHVYLRSYCVNGYGATTYTRDLYEATEALCNYLFFLLVARPYMLPYPVTRQRYVQLCHDCNTRLTRSLNVYAMRDAILEQKADLIKESPIRPNADGVIAPVSQSEETSHDGDIGVSRPPVNNTWFGVFQKKVKNYTWCGGTAQPPVNNTRVGETAQSSINSTLDKGCKLAAQLVNTSERGRDAVRFQEMVFEVWVEMLCYTAYNCNEKSHAKNLTNGGELMTIVALIMVYMSNGFIKTENSGAAAGTSSWYTLTK